MLEAPELTLRYELPLIPPKRHTLYPYQELGLDAFRSWWADKKDDREALIALATGLGKTHLAAACIEGVLKLDKVNDVMWLTNRQELVNQTQDDLEGFLGIGVDIEQAHLRASGASPVRITTALTTKGKRLESLIKSGYDPKLIVIDEAHHSEAATVKAIENAFPAARVLNLTATPFRSDISKMMSLGKVLAQMCIEDATKGGLLVPIEPSKYAIEVEGLDLKKIPGNCIKELGGVTGLMTSDSIIASSTDAIIAEFGAHPEVPVMKGIVYCCNQSHGVAVTSQLKSKAPHLRIAELYDFTPKKERIDIITKYKAGKLDLLVNNMVLTEGFNDPSTNFIAMLRPTADASLWTQIVGRGLRLSLGKSKCILMDPIDRRKTVGVKLDEGLPNSDELRRRSIELGRPVSMAELVLHWFRRLDEANNPTTATPLTTLTAAQIYKSAFPYSFNSKGLLIQKGGSKRIKLLDQVLVGKTWPRKDPTGMKALMDVFGIPNGDGRGLSTLRKFLNDGDRPLALGMHKWVYCPHLKHPSIPTSSGTAPSKSNVNVVSSAFLQAHPSLTESVTNLFNAAMLDAQQLQNYCEVLPISKGSKLTMPWLKPLGGLVPVSKPNNFHYVASGLGNSVVYYARGKSGKIYEFYFGYDNKGKYVSKVKGTKGIPNVLTTSLLPGTMHTADSLVVAASPKQLSLIAPILGLSYADCARVGVTKIVASAIISQQQSESFRTKNKGLSNLDKIKTWLDTIGEL